MATRFAFPTRPLSSTTFRLSLVYFAIFTVSALALLSFVYVASVDFMHRQTEETIEAELTGLREQYRDLGLFGLGRIITRRAAAETELDSAYLLLARDGRLLAGNLTSWPEGEDVVQNRVQFAVEGPDGRPRRFIGRIFDVEGRARLLVARDIEDKLRTQELLVNAIIAGSGLMLVLGIVGGVVMSRWTMQRIDIINRTTQRIMAGDLGRRIDVAGSGDEFDALAANLNAMLDRIERLVGGMREVTDNIAHDLRTPLTRLRSRLDVALLGELDPATARQLLEETVADADGLIATFNSLLRIARAEAGEERGPWQPVALDEIARDVFELYEPLAEENELALQLEAGPGPTVAGNRELLAQAVANLVDNAIKYTPRGGRITIATAAEIGRGGIVEVRDSGPGIPAELRDKALERFVRLEPDRSTPGNGLGLSLVKAVARLHEAELELADNDPGLRVRLTFPVAAPAAAAS